MAGETDWLTAANAQILAEQLEEFWASHGGKVKAHIEQGRVGRGAHAGFYCVRSDMKNGLPRDWDTK